MKVVPICKAIVFWPEGWCVLPTMQTWGAPCEQTLPPWEFHSLSIFGPQLIQPKLQSEHCHKTFHSKGVKDFGSLLAFVFISCP